MALLFWSAFFSTMMPCAVHAGVTVAEVLEHVAPIGPWWSRRELLSELRPVKLIDGTIAMTVLVGDTQWTPKGEPTYVQRVAAGKTGKPPPTDAEILEKYQKDYTRYFDYSQIWFVDKTVFPQADAGLKALLSPEDHPNSHERDLGFIGYVDQWAVYAYTPISSWVFVQKRLKAIGGDDPLSAATRGLQSKDGYNSEGCRSILAGAGANAVPYVRDLIASSPLKKHYAGCLSGMS